MKREFKKSGIDFGRLADAIRSSRRYLRHFRQKRRDVVLHLGGSHYSEESRLRTPVNLIGLYVDIVTRSLVPRSPRVLLTTFEPEAKPVAKAMQDWLNDQLVNVTDVFERWVMDALCGLGILKVGLARPSESQAFGYEVGAGQPFLDVVDIDDFAFDIGCTRLSHAAFVAHRVRLPLDGLKQEYPKAKISAVPYRRVDDSEERTDSIGRTELIELEDMATIWEVYLPRSRMVVVLSENEDIDVEPLDVKEWMGPPTGPYYFLGFGTIPGNPLPKPPLFDLLDLHVSANRLVSKMLRQAERQKNVTPVRSASMPQVQEFINASDGDVVRFDGDPPVEVSIGSPNRDVGAIADMARQLFSWRAGNLDIMGGLRTMGRTATQDSILNENSSKSLADKQMVMIRELTRAISAFAWFWYHHPTAVMKTEVRVQDYTYTRVLNPLTGSGLRRNIPWDKMRLSIDVYSMVPLTPEERAARVVETLRGVILPLAPAFAQSGMSINPQAVLKMLAQYRNMPEIEEIMQPAVQAGEGELTQPPEPREYIRRSAGAQGQEKAIMDNFLRSSNGTED